MQVYMNYIYDHSNNLYYALPDVNHRNYLRDTFCLDIFGVHKNGLSQVINTGYCLYFGGKNLADILLR